MPSPAGATGREFGKSFEKIFEARARSNGLLALKNNLTGILMGGGGVKLVRSELDYTLIRRGTQCDPALVAYIDCKTFNAEHFSYSDLLSRREPRDHQISRALMYNDWGIPAGFVVWLRKGGSINPSDGAITYVTGRQVATMGPGTRFMRDTGLYLGTLQTFDLRPVFG